MIDFLLELVDFNREVPNYNFIIPLILLYLFTLWLIVSIWVFYDARKRFERVSTALLFAVGNLVLQFPFLFVYLLIRPHTQEDFEDWIDGGVNVPIVNFTGNDGVEMSFELRVFPKRLVSEKESEMKIDVSFASNDENKVVSVQKPVVVSDSQTAPKKKSGLNLATIVSSVNGRLKAVKAKLSKPKSAVAPVKTEEKVEDKPVFETEQKSDSVEMTQPSENGAPLGTEHKKKKKKKKRR